MASLHEEAAGQQQQRAAGDGAARAVDAMLAKLTADAQVGATLDRSTLKESTRRSKLALSVRLRFSKQPHALRLGRVQCPTIPPPPLVLLW